MEELRSLALKAGVTMVDFQTTMGQLDYDKDPLVKGRCSVVLPT